MPWVTVTVEPRRRSGWNLNLPALTRMLQGLTAAWAPSQQLETGGLLLRLIWFTPYYWLLIPINSFFFAGCLIISGRYHQQSGECIYMQNMQNTDLSVFCILCRNFTMQCIVKTGLHIFQYIFCIFCILFCIVFVIFCILLAYFLTYSAYYFAYLLSYSIFCILFCIFIDIFCIYM